MEAIKQADRRKTTHLLKKHLKELFENTFKIRSESYSGGSSINISWELGPSESQVSEIVNDLKYGHFNSMEDIYEYSNRDKVLIIEGYELEQFKYVFVKQEISDAVKNDMVLRFSELIQISEAPPFDIENPNENFPNGMIWGSWNWKQLFHRYFKQRDFSNVKGKDFTIVGAQIDNINEDGVVFIYEVEGTRYNTLGEEMKETIEDEFFNLRDKAIELLKAANIPTTGIYETIPEAICDAVQTVHQFNADYWLSQTIFGPKTKSIVLELSKL